MTLTPRLDLPLIDAAQAQKHITHNEAIAALDQLVQTAVLSRTLVTPPASPADGDAYLVAATGSGAWASQTGALAAWFNGTWNFYQPQTGWMVWCIAEARVLVWTGAAWADAFGLLSQNVPQFGLGTAADATNPLSAKLNRALFTARSTAEGGTGDLRFTLNKAAVGNTVSQLYQTNYSGRAETGLTGDDRFHFKVSADGATWREAIVIDPATGASTLLSLVLQSALSIANGGTGATTAAAALANLGAAPATSPNFGGTANFANTPTIGGAALSALYPLLGSNPVFTGQTLNVGAGDATYKALNLNAAAGQFRYIRTLSAGSTRWDFGCDSSPETGGNAGSNFYINAFSDTSSFLLQPFTIARATGVANFGVTPTIGGASLSSLYAPLASPVFAGTVKMPSYTVATLPAAGIAGRVVHCSNARMFNGAGTLEGAGLGTGGLVMDNGAAWKVAGTNVTVSA